ncbi:MAG: NnrS family protein [Sulfuricella sp.]|nr:NnrS family protein [Sulfuricella sp.]
MTTTTSPWRAFSAAPHRMMFFAGATQGVLTILWWLVDLLGRYTGLYAPLIWPVVPQWAHGFLMIYGFFPFFIFGFLMTVYPNWMNGEPVPRRRYIPAFALLAGGQVLFYAGLFVGKPVLLVGVLSVLAGWAVAYYALLRVLFGAVHPDKLHPAITAVALGFAWLGIAAYAAWLAGAGDGFAVFSLKTGVWLFLVPVFFTVSHRMIPFFSSRIIDGYHIVRPKWALWTVLSCSAAHGILEMVGAERWLWLVDIPFVAASLHLTWHWQIFKSFKERLLAVLHIGFAWLSLALALSALQSLAALAGYPVFGFAPLHALTIGFFASMVLAMATRVTLGHSGRELKADGATWALFLAFQAAALTRIAGDLPLPHHGHFYLLAAVIWLGCFIPWWVKYAPVYLRPRQDGVAG